MTFQQWKRLLQESAISLEDVQDYTRLQEEYLEARRNHQLLHLFYADDFEKLYGEEGRECRKELVRAETRLNDNKFYRSIPKKV